jgi:triosephosphate isomerase
MGVIRGSFAGLSETPILYGGSMKAENVPSYMREANVNGGLVGGASLDPGGFATLIGKAAR